MSGPKSPHRQAYAYCANCPKLCRFACPVAEVTRSETTSTWGKMTAAHLAQTGQRPLDAGAARALHACTGCMRCTTWCEHQNQPGWALMSARQGALSAGLSPEGARTTVATFAEHGNPFGRELGEKVARFAPEGPVRYQLFPGCSALVKREPLVRAALAVGARMGAPLAVSRVSARCCGYPLYAAGDEAAFGAHARRIAALLEGYPELVVLDPGCAYTFLVVYPRVGVELGTRVRTLYEVLDERLEQVGARPPLPLTVAYQDACHLGRGLGQYEGPRRLLRAAVATVREAPMNREEAGCSGGGGLLPRTMSEVATQVARAQAEAAAPGGEPLVTACPTSRRMFERAGRASEDLLEVLARWLEVEGR